METRKAEDVRPCVHERRWESEGLVFCERCGRELEQRFSWESWEGNRCQVSVWVEK